MVTGTTTTMLRSAVNRSCGLQPKFLHSTTTTAFQASPFCVRPKLSTTASFSTAAPTPSVVLTLHHQQRRQQPNSQAPTTIITAATRAPAASRPSACRYASSGSDHAQDAAAAARAAQRASAAAALHPDAPQLDWNTFFQLRKSRRRWQVAFSVVSSLASGSGGALLLSTGAADALTANIPLDPVLTLGLMTMGFIALGWLAGPSLGSSVFYLINRKYKVPMTVKESQFFARIKKNRVDPSNSSTGNPVPDFYGEKISSVAGYRQWLKDQRAYNKKRTTFI